MPAKMSVSYGWQAARRELWPEHLPGTQYQRVPVARLHRL